MALSPCASTFASDEEYQFTEQSFWSAVPGGPKPPKTHAGPERQKDNSCSADTCPSPRPPGSPCSGTGCAGNSRGGGLLGGRGGGGLRGLLGGGKLGGMLGQGMQGLFPMLLAMMAGNQGGSQNSSGSTAPSVAASEIATPAPTPTVAPVVTLAPVGTTPPPAATVPPQATTPAGSPTSGPSSQKAVGTIAPTSSNLFPPVNIKM